jgi:hypothetical protein
MASEARKLTFIKLTLEVEVAITLPLPDGFAEHMDATLLERSDGRKNFSVELVEDGLCRAVKTAFERVLMMGARSTLLETSRDIKDLSINICDLSCTSAIPNEDEP